MSDGVGCRMALNPTILRNPILATACASIHIPGHGSLELIPVEDGETRP